MQCNVGALYIFHQFRICIVCFVYTKVFDLGIYSSQTRHFSIHCCYKLACARHSIVCLSVCINPR